MKFRALQNQNKQIEKFSDIKSLASNIREFLIYALNYPTKQRFINAKLNYHDSRFARIASKSSIN